MELFVRLLVGNYKAIKKKNNPKKITHELPRAHAAEVSWSLHQAGRPGERLPWQSKPAEGVIAHK